ncbi:MAG: hypothetical protein JO254_16930 [Pseudolabrys sp.]|nr:hypothetical protein [Pseudolabrys sp.]
MLRAVLAITGLFAASAALAQRPAPPPPKIAPEYREMYEARQKEKAAILACHRKADLAKVNVRDRTKFVIDCLDHPAPPEAPPVQPNQRTL